MCIMCVLLTVEVENFIFIVISSFFLLFVNTRRSFVYIIHDFAFYSSHIL
jgi:hypothetical protein